MNSRQTLFLAFSVGLLLGAPLSACGTKPQACGPANCETGCCDELGECRQGNESTACGRRGGWCEVCSVGNACTNGFCGVGPGVGGGDGNTGGGSAVTGGGDATTGGGTATTGGGMGGDGGATGGGSGATGGGSAVPSCGYDNALTFVNKVAFVDGGSTMGTGNEITLTCFPSLSRGDDLVYYFALSTAGGFSADLTFDNSVGAFGGLALTNFGSCTPRSNDPQDCTEPINEFTNITTTLPAGQYGLVVKSYPGNSGTFWLKVSTDAGLAGGGPGGGAGGGSGNTGGGSGNTGGGPSGWNCAPRFYDGNDGCDCGCGIRDPDCASSSPSACDYCSDDGSCANDGSSNQCDTSLLRSNNNALCGSAGGGTGTTGGGTGATGGGTGTTGGGTGSTGGGTGATGGGTGTCVEPDGVVISAVYSNGGNSGATYSFDFVELHNRSSASVSLATWSLQYGAGGNSNQFTTKVNLTGNIAAGGYVLVRGAEGTSVPDVQLPVNFDIDRSTGSPALALGGSAGKLALVKSQTQLTGCPSSVGASSNVADIVAWGSTSCSPLGSPTAQPSGTTALFRNDERCAHTNGNSADFSVSSVGQTLPRNSSTTANTCSCQ